MTTTILSARETPSTRVGSAMPVFRWRAAGGRVLRIPLIGKLLGANLVIAVAGAAASALSGRPGTLAFAAIALTLGCVCNVLLVRLALKPLDELERVTDAVARGEEYVRVTASTIADERVDRLGSTVNRLLDTVGRDRLRIHQLIQRSLAAREAERAVLSTQLRETTAQHLCAITLQVATAERALDTGSGRSALRAAREVSSQLLVDVRDLADAVYPGLVHELGLSTALSALAARIRSRSSLSVTVETSGATEHLAPALVTAMYHVAEEAARNVERHANARSVHLRLSTANGSVRLEIRDDGTGFDVQATERCRLCVGLFQIRELLASVHGKLEISSSRPGGTQVVATARLDQGDTT